MSAKQGLNSESHAPGTAGESCEDRDFLCCDYFPCPVATRRGTKAWTEWYNYHVFEYNKIRTMEMYEGD